MSKQNVQHRQLRHILWTVCVWVCVLCIVHITTSFCVPFASIAIRSYGIKRLFAVRANVFNEMVQVASRIVRKLLWLLLLWSMNIVCACAYTTHSHSRTCNAQATHDIKTYENADETNTQTIAFVLEIHHNQFGLSLSLSLPAAHVCWFRFFFCFHFKSCALCCRGYYSALET